MLKKDPDLKPKYSLYLIRLFMLTFFTGLPWSYRVVATTMGQPIEIPHNLFFTVLAYTNNIVALVTIVYLIYCFKHLKNTIKYQETKAKFNFFKEKEL